VFSLKKFGRENRKPRNSTRAIPAILRREKCSMRLA
jgi:hypothetical protein